MTLQGRPTLHELGQERLTSISTNLFPLAINIGSKPQRWVVTVTLPPAESWCFFVTAQQNGDPHTVPKALRHFQISLF